ncbi:hypothetical protein JYU34_014862 [Plutella xylostella]|uniref:Uncharacterized protein n=1 Tax=Plutella xylostella TaxID=51655 RepID=A0ABQ7Q5N9_PLUXY|nr:hypothetical protein JYU34_014862 [Plutella xylostella]
MCLYGSVRRAGGALRRRAAVRRRQRRAGLSRFHLRHSRSVGHRVRVAAGVLPARVALRQPHRLPRRLRRGALRARVVGHIVGRVERGVGHVGRGAGMQQRAVPVRRYLPRGGQRQRHVQRQQPRRGVYTCVVAL